MISISFHRSALLASLLLLFLFLFHVTLSETVTITTPEEYYAIQQSINSGTFDSSSEIVLDSDLDFSNFTEILEPIGTKLYPFKGTFLGNNHTISNFLLHVSTYEYAGFFGYATDGTTIRDLIFDSSCSVTSAWSGSTTAYVGGILGYCTLLATATSGCHVNNAVYMGKVVYAGDASTAYIGGIAGYANVLGAECDVTHCVSGAAISLVLSKSKNVYMGGIIGTAFSNFKNPSNVTIEFCVSLGSFSGNIDKTTGAILGRSTGNNTISTCMYNKSAFGRHAGTTNYVGSVLENMMGFEDNFTLFSDGSLMSDAVNRYVDEERFGDLVEWMFEKHSVSFNTNGGNKIRGMETFQIMTNDAIPSAEKYFYIFDGWTLDKKGEVKFEKSVVYDKDFVLYAKWKFMWQMFGMIFDIFFVIVVSLIFIYDVVNPHFYF